MIYNSSSGVLSIQDVQAINTSDVNGKRKCKLNVEKGKGQLWFSIR